MGITKYGIWVHFLTKEDAKKTAKELNIMMNRYGVFIMDKLKVLENNSLKFYLSNKQIIEEVSWKFNQIKYVWIDLGKGWKMDIAGADLWKEGESKLKEFAISEGDKQ